MKCQKTYKMIYLYFRQITDSLAHQFVSRKKNGRIENLLIFGSRLKSREIADRLRLYFSNLLPFSTDKDIHVLFNYYVDDNY